MKQTILILGFITVFAQWGYAQSTIGFEFAGSRDFQYGSLGVADPTAGANGLGFGYMASVTTEFTLTRLWSFGLHAGFRAQSVNGVYEKPTAATETYHLSLWAQIGLALFRRCVIAVGPDFSYLTGSKVHVSNNSMQTISSPIRFSVGGVASMRHDITIGSIIITPSASYDHMLSSLNDSGTLGFRIGSLYGAIGMKFRVD